MPLIANTNYRQLRQIALGAEIDLPASDRHPEALAHLALAINRDSPLMRSMSNLARGIAPQIRVDPLSWLGNTVSIYIDADPFWQDLAATEDRDAFYRRESFRMPLGVTIASTDGLKLTMFLAGFRAFIEQAAPGMTVWETRKHGEESYVRIGASERASTGDWPPENMAIYYSASGDSLILSVNENVLRRAIDRQAARRKAEAEVAIATSDPNGKWLGDHVAAEVREGALQVVDAYHRDQYIEHLQTLSWNNLIILNEWKRRYPESDPVELHQAFWGRRLVCPGEGEYRWNSTWQTMESTVFGSPGDPKEVSALPNVLSQIDTVRCGLTFEDDGLRGRVHLSMHRD